MLHSTEPHTLYLQQLTCIFCPMLAPWNRCMLGFW